MFGDSFFKKTVKNIFDVGTWLILGLSIILAAIVAIAQTALPGMATYKVKTGFEAAVLAGFKIIGQDSRYQIDLTKLRFEETQKVISSSNASLSLNNLYQQIISTEYSIESISDPKQKSQTAKQYISTLTSISDQLEQKKSSVSPSPTSPTLIPTIATTDTSYSNDEQKMPTVVPTETISSQQIIINEQISQTQQQIQETINNLNSIPTPPQEPEFSPDQNSQTTDSQPTITPKNDNNSENSKDEHDKGKKDKDKHDKDISPTP